MSLFVTYPFQTHPAKIGQFKRNPLRRLVAAEVEVAESNLGIDDDDDRSSCDCDDDDCNCDRRPREGAAWPSDALAVFRKWGISCVSDGSLPSGGFELPLAPASGDKWLEQCEDVGRILRAAGASVTSSCGLHIHADARDYRWADMRRLMLVYAKVEPVLFDMVPSRRRESSYAKACGELYQELATTPNEKLSHVVKKRMYPDGRSGAPWQLYRTDEAYAVRHRAAWTDDYRYVKNDRDYTTSQLIHANLAAYIKFRERQLMKASGDSWMRAKREKYHSNRYNACNLHSWLYRGTVELRLPPGTVVAAKIAAWGMLWAGVVEFALATPDSQLTPMLHFMTAHELLTETAVNDTVKDFISTRLSAWGRD